MRHLAYCPAHDRTAANTPTAALSDQEESSAGEEQIPPQKKGKQAKAKPQPVPDDKDADSGSGSGSEDAADE